MRRLAALLTACALLAPPAARAATPPALVARLASLLDDHAVLHVGEFHRSRELHALLQDLLHDPAFACRLDDVVVEFGNARLQPVADAYASGADVPEAQVLSMLRETAVPLAWNAPMYRQVYDAVRAANASKLCAHPIRLVLADPPLDWAAIATVEQYRSFDVRDAHMAETVEREVLAKGHHALLVTGQWHALRQLPRDLQDESVPANVAQLLEQRHPGAVFVLTTLPSPAAAQALGMEPAPSFRIARGTPLGDADFGMTRPGWPTGETLESEHRLRIGEAVDGLVYLGGNHSVFPSPAIYLDPAYQAELRRRARIIKAYSGQDFEAVIDDLVRQANDGGEGRQNNVPAD